jgi:hypothetical protein
MLLLVLENNRPNGYQYSLYSYATARSYPVMPLWTPPWRRLELADTPPRDRSFLLMTCFLAASGPRSALVTDRHPLSLRLKSQGWVFVLSSTMYNPTASFSSFLGLARPIPCTQAACAGPGNGLVRMSAFWDFVSTYSSRIIPCSAHSRMVMSNGNVLNPRVRRRLLGECYRALVVAP